MKKSLIYFIVFFIAASSSAQTPKKVNQFPEDYLGKTVTFKNVAFWPRLHELNGYYEVLINTSDDVDGDTWGFGSLDKIYGAVMKPLAKKMISANFGGKTTQYYYGSVTGRIIKSKVFGSDYIFLITKIVNHPINEPNNIVHFFKYP
ncbi:hypothetical protein [Mucilaginibacter sp. KACC 22063]|uniref:hypothetical protein n=1 Tax=Mucilaginibacter sp. KACC 22063 TaxID=3025666 RepID=UPI0023650881|nr:hypothetical protein [Mucilaginibacter sp. KACC 22063]WDF55263.1 hypothetical protein PQ461_20225 [Mucilaginibacter sp. KACC 22063]